MPGRKPQGVFLPPNTSKGLARLGNDCLILILSFLLARAGPDDFSELQLPRWIRTQSVCKQLYQVCHSPQLIGLLDVVAYSPDVLQKFSRMAGVQRLTCQLPYLFSYAYASDNNWCELLPKFQSLQELNLLSDVTERMIQPVALCTALKSLSVAWESSKMVQMCSTLTSLERLQSTGLTKRRLEIIALFTNLHELDVSHCSHVSDEGLKLLSHLSLRRLNVSETFISDVGLLSLNLQSIEKLEMQDTRITDAPFPHLRSLSSLAISFSRTAGLVALTSLTDLTLVHCTTNAAHQVLSTLTNLKRLELSCSGLDLRGLNLPRLQSLALSGNGLVNFDALSCLVNLESLTLSSPDDSLGKHVAELSALAGLKMLSLAHNSGFRTFPFVPSHFVDWISVIVQNLLTRVCTVLGNWDSSRW